MYLKSGAERDDIIMSLNTNLIISKKKFKESSENIETKVINCLVHHNTRDGIVIDPDANDTVDGYNTYLPSNLPRGVSLKHVVAEEAFLPN